MSGFLEVVRYVIMAQDIGEEAWIYDTVYNVNEADGIVKEENDKKGYNWLWMERR